MSRSKQESYRIYGSPERQAFVRSLGCLIDGSEPELAHTRSGGMGRKADAETIVPLCRQHHSELHQHGVKTFEQSWGVDLHATAAYIEEKWKERGG